MQVLRLQNNSATPNFGIRISLKTVRRANQACIERERLARSKGLTLAQYDALHREDFVHRIGDKTYDFYAIAKEIVANKGKMKKMNEAFGNAFRNARSKLSENK